MNSLKMKLSVLFGVLQMCLGVVLRFMNAFYFRNMTDVLCECIPMAIFMICFFGWMDFMIVYKWVYKIDDPPGIINSLICMAMGPMGVGQEDTQPLWGGDFTSVQLSTKLMYAALLSVPWLLLPKPFILLMQHNRKEKAKAEGHVALVDEEEAGGAGHGEHGEEFEFGEIFIHQVIETIEYVLGTVSHTASYLRVWALSLAHQQLSAVFFEKTISMGIALPFPMNGIAMYFLFGAWFGATAMVLLGMDVLECFLHTLRLHWVEFQSKFYRADGVLFEPYSVRNLIALSDA